MWERGGKYILGLTKNIMKVILKIVKILFNNFKL